MKSKHLLTLFTLFAAIHLSAQNLKPFYGTWQYHDIYEKEKIDADGLKMLQMLFGNMVISFEEDGKYSASLMNKSEEGNWVLGDDGKTMTINSSDGKSNKMEVVSLDESHLTIKVGNGVFIMKKSE